MNERRFVGPGDELAGFVLESVAGRGGMGVVYRARQVSPDRVVAVKVIAPELANDPTFCARFRRESTIAAQIEHPNVIPVYAAGEEDGVLFIVMRFVGGTDLRTLIAEKARLDARRATRIVDQVGHALDAAHSQGLVHRDVKPANILIAPLAGREHVYLTDFGLTRHAESGSDQSGGVSLTGTGAFLGTVDYVAPEQARGERVDARTDVYSLGCVLLHALTGVVPFPAANDLGKLFAHATQAPPTLRDRGIAAPESLEEVLARALAKEPEERYLSAGDLGRAAVAAASGESVSRTDRSVAAGDAAPRSANIGRGLAATKPPPTQSTLDSGIMGRGLAATKPPRVPRKPGNPPVIRDRSRLEED